MEAEGSWAGSTGTRLDHDGRFLGLLGYAPRHYESAEALLDENGDRLRALRGQRLRRSFAVWLGGVMPALQARLRRQRSYAWFTDAPVILDFGVARLELAAFKDHICVSWDLIDVTEPIDWYGGDLRLDWRENALGELVALRGCTIDAIRIVEYRGMLNGIQFCSGERCAELFNALDELGITDAPESEAENVRLQI